MELTSENVFAVIDDCFAGKDALPVNTITIAGVRVDYIFNPKKVQAHKQNIESMIDQLPLMFRSTGDGAGLGGSFLDMVIDINNNQWTDLHGVAEGLLALGIAIGKMDYNLPRSLWHALPGGMPYVYIK